MFVQLGRVCFSLGWFGWSIVAIDFVRDMLLIKHDQRHFATTYINVAWFCWNMFAFLSAGSVGSVLSSVSFGARLRVTMFIASAQRTALNHVDWFHWVVSLG